MTDMVSRVHSLHNRNWQKALRPEGKAMTGKWNILALEDIKPKS